MARPHIKINWEEFDKLCHIMATQEDIAHWFNCSVDTLERACRREKGESYAAYYKRKSAGGRISVTRAQYQAAVQEHNPTMLIWMGKQHLGQKDQPALAITQNNNSATIIDLGGKTITAKELFAQLPPALVTQMLVHLKKCNSTQNHLPPSQPSSHPSSPQEQVMDLCEPRSTDSNETSPQTMQTSSPKNS